MKDKRKHEVISASIILLGILLAAMGSATDTDTHEILGATVAILGVLTYILGGEKK